MLTVNPEAVAKFNDTLPDINKFCHVPTPLESETKYLFAPCEPSINLKADCVANIVNRCVGLAVPIPITSTNGITTDAVKLEDEVAVNCIRLLSNDKELPLELSVPKTKLKLEGSNILKLGACIFNKLLIDNIII